MGEWGGAPESCARYLRCCDLRASFVCKGIPWCVCACCSRTCIDHCCGFSVVMPLQARVTLEIVHFDGRAVGGAPEGCARCLMCRCEHILNAKSSRDAFAAQRHEGHFCGCVMHGQATQGSCIAQDGAFDGRAVGGAHGAIFIYGAITNTLWLRHQDPGTRFWAWPNHVCRAFLRGFVYGQAASSSCFDWDVAHFDGRAVRGAPGVARAVWRIIPLRALFGYGVISGRVCAWLKTRIKYSCDCVHRWATPSPCNLRHDLFGWSSFLRGWLAKYSCAACYIWGAVASNSWVPRASALRRRGSVHLQREYRRLRSTTLKKLLAKTRCGAAMADGVATIPSIRPNGARSGLSDQLAQAVQISSARG